VEIEITNFCNLRCSICPRGNLGFVQEPVRHMSLTDFKKIVDSYDYSIDRFQFCGASEPTANPQLVKMVEYVTEKKTPKVVELITNGTLLTEALSRQLIGAGLTMLRASIDGPDEVTYQAIRHHKLAPIIRNLKGFARAAEDRNVSFGINCVITRSNMDSIIHMAKFAHDVGANALELRIFEWNLEQLDRLAMHDEEKLRALCEAVGREAQRCSLTCNFWDFEETATKACNLVSEANISCKGYLTPCYHLPKRHIGTKLGGAPFSSHWNSSALVSIVEGTAVGKFLPACSCLVAIRKRKTGTS